jgi:hypothetical protein
MHSDFQPTLPFGHSDAEPASESVTEAITEPITKRFRPAPPSFLDPRSEETRGSKAYRVAEVVQAPGRQDLQLRRHPQAHPHPLSALQSLSRHSLSPHVHRVLVLREDDPQARRPVWVLDLHPPQHIGRGQPVLNHMAAARPVVFDTFG